MRERRHPNGTVSFKYGQLFQRNLSKANNYWIINKMPNSTTDAKNSQQYRQVSQFGRTCCSAYHRSTVIKQTSTLDGLLKNKPHVRSPKLKRPPKIERHLRSKPSLHKCLHNIFTTFASYYLLYTKKEDSPAISQKIFRLSCHTLNDIHFLFYCYYNTLRKGIYYYSSININVHHH